MAGITINQRVKRARLSAGLTQAELAKKIGVAQPTIALWEKENPIPAKKLSTLETVLGPIRNRKKSKSAKSKKKTEDLSQDDYAGRDPVSAVGVWVRERRAKAGFTPGELATKAGISYQTIIFLESGRIQSPQKKTLEKLQIALDQKLPKEIESEVAKETKIGTDIGNLTDFDPHDRDDWPTGPGVYVLYDISQRPIYVGKGSAINTRLADHVDKFWFRRPVVENASYVSVEDEALRHKLEQVLIKFLKSNAVINKQSVESF